MNPGTPAQYAQQKAAASGSSFYYAFQIAISHISQCAQFFDISAIREPGSKPKLWICVAMRLT